MTGAVDFYVGDDTRPTAGASGPGSEDLARRHALLVALKRLRGRAISSITVERRNDAGMVLERWRFEVAP